MGSIRKILVATDFSESSAEAARMGVDLARQLGATITLLSAYMPPVFAAPDGSVLLPAPEVLRELDDNTTARLATAAKELARSGVAVETLAVEGPPAERIVETAIDGAFDLVVMGTHGRTGLKHLLLGSVAERVVRSAHCPVLTVRPGTTAAQGEERPAEAPARP